MPSRPRRRAYQSHKFSIAAGLLLTLLLLQSAVAGYSAQESRPGQRLQITSLDRSSFPDVGVNLILTDGQSRPLDNLSGLRLRENGVPIAEYDVRQETVGLDLIFVIEGDESLLRTEADGNLTRLQKIRDTILFYSGRFMDVAGRDHVSVIVPGAENGRVLVEDVTEPAALIEAMRGYEPEEVPATPADSMLEQALDLAQRSQGSGRFQAIVLFSDTRRLNSFLFPQLVERAQALRVPIFGLVLAPAQNEDAMETMSGLTVPTRGVQVALPTASDSSELFDVVQNNAVQTQLRYESNIQRSGSFPIEVTMGGDSAEATLELELAPPLARIEPPTSIRRTGTEIDSPLSELQPGVQPVTVHIEWPDGLPRRLAAATLHADGEAQEAPFVGGDQTLLFDWNISELGAGQVALTARITDTLGLSAESEPVVVTVEVVRPQPLPTATATPTRAPLAFVTELAPDVDREELLSAPVLGAIALLLALIWFASRRFATPVADQAQAAMELEEAAQRASATNRGAPDTSLTARLEPVEGRVDPVSLSGDGATLGSSAEHVDIAMDDSSISPLHARIRRRGDTYWLYDEGSESGTMLNYERLGLAPKALADGDEIQLGRVRLRFRVISEEEAGEDETIPPN